MQKPNHQLVHYLKIYENIQSEYINSIQEYGLPMADQRSINEIRPNHPLLNWENNKKSCYYGWRSPACSACRQGDESISLFISLKCHRTCYYCFNANQENHASLCKKIVDAAERVKEYKQNGHRLSHIALTGGEPLLYKAETLAFFSLAKQYYPKAYYRLYTSGDLLDEGLLRKLSEVGLNEIRFSIKLEDDEAKQAEVYRNIAMAKKYISVVMVEMPVIPNTLTQMQNVLKKLDWLGIKGINLLEFCFPFNKTEEFIKHGFKIKNPPFKVFYNYDYAGGVPIDGSETLALTLMQFAIDNQLNLGVHYCSLENKFTAQIFEQNHAYREKLKLYFSLKDFFFKTIKVFGKDIDLVLDIFAENEIDDYKFNQQYHYIEFHPRYVELLQKANVKLQVGVAYYVVENRKGDHYLRELHIDVCNTIDIQGCSL